MPFPDIDYARIPESAWEFAGFTPDGLARIDICWIDRENGIFAQRKINLVEPELLEMNRQEYDASQTKRFGDGRVVARVPLNVFFRDFAARLKEGDTDFNKWWLNHSENRPYRTFRGKF